MTLGYSRLLYRYTTGILIYYITVDIYVLGDT